MILLNCNDCLWISAHKIKYKCKNRDYYGWQFNNLALYSINNNSSAINVTTNQNHTYLHKNQSTTKK